MANFKRGRRKNVRAGCLHCKPQKANGQRLRLRAKGSDLRRLDSADEQIRDQGDAEADALRTGRKDD